MHSEDTWIKLMEITLTKLFLKLDPKFNIIFGDVTSPFELTTSFHVSPQLKIFYFPSFASLFNNQWGFSMQSI